MMAEAAAPGRRLARAFSVALAAPPLLPPPGPPCSRLPVPGHVRAGSGPGRLRAGLIPAPLLPPLPLLCRYGSGAVAPHHCGPAGAPIAVGPETIDYPESDGQPMAETEAQYWPLLYVGSALDWYFQECEDVSVVGNLLLYYQEGAPGKAVAPALMVVLGAPKHLRSS